FTAIAVAGSPRHHLRHGRAFPRKQKAVLIFEALQPAPRYVVLVWRRGLVCLRLSGKPFSRLVVVAARIQWCTGAIAYTQTTCSTGAMPLPQSSAAKIMDKPCSPTCQAFTLTQAHKPGNKN